VSSQQDLVDGLIAARARHADRGPGIRAAQIGAGLSLLVVAIPLSVLVAELGVPALLLALRLLADEFDWAARAYAAVAVRWERFQTWFAARNGAVKVLVLLATSIVAIVLVVALA
jgi:hypothetical protein